MIYPGILAKLLGIDPALMENRSQSSSEGKPRPSSLNAAALKSGPGTTRSDLHKQDRSRSSDERDRRQDSSSRATPRPPSLH